MQNALGFWDDPKYSLIRHAVVAGGAGAIIAVLQALSQTDFGPTLDIVVATVSGLLIRFLTKYASGE